MIACSLSPTRAAASFALTGAAVATAAEAAAAIEAAAVEVPRLLLSFEALMHLNNNSRAFSGTLTKSDDRIFRNLYETGLL